MADSSNPWSRSGAESVALEQRAGKPRDLSLRVLKVVEAGARLLVHAPPVRVGVELVLLDGLVPWSRARTRSVELRAQRVCGIGRRRRRRLPPQPPPHRKTPHNASEPGKSLVHGLMLLCRGLLLRNATTRGRPDRRRNWLQHDYEILLMLDPELPEARQDEIIARIRELIENGGGTWVGHDPWGRRKLAFEIDKKTDGIYHLLQFDAEPATLDELTRILKITDGVMRHLPDAPRQGWTRPRPPWPEPVESAGREPEYAAANTRSSERSPEQDEEQEE